MVPHPSMVVRKFGEKKQKLSAYQRCYSVKMNIYIEFQSNLSSTRGRLIDRLTYPSLRPFSKNDTQSEITCPNANTHLNCIHLLFCQNQYAVLITASPYVINFPKSRNKSRSANQTPMGVDSLNEVICQIHIVRASAVNSLKATLFSSYNYACGFYYFFHIHLLSPIFPISLLCGKDNSGISCSIRISPGVQM